MSSLQHRCIVMYFKLMKEKGETKKREERKQQDIDPELPKERQKKSGTLSVQSHGRSGRLAANRARPLPRISKVEHLGRDIGGGISNALPRCTVCLPTIWLRQYAW